MTLSGQDDRRENLHASALLAGDRGVLITGPSGSGKTTLALALVEHVRGRGLFSRLVADDQLFVADRAGRLVCTTPRTIAGLVEVPGIGPQPTAFELAAVIDLCIRLVPEDAMERFQEPATTVIAGCPIPRLDLAERNVTAALPAVTARLGLAPFV